MIMKRIISAVLIISLIFVFSACSGKSASVLPAASAVADALSEGLKFGDEMEKNELLDYNLGKYGIDASLVTELVRYVGSGATADEVAVFKCNSSDAEAQVKKAVESRVEYLREGYASYGPQEIPKIDNAVILEYGNDIVFCICEDSENVKSIVDNLIK